jgi:hypothetical protein
VTRQEKLKFTGGKHMRQNKCEQKDTIFVILQPSVMFVFLHANIQFQVIKFTLIEDDLHRHVEDDIHS